ncbi:MAG: transporter [Desulfuromonadaceae bacterium]|nr:transporter [Desulfuromonadaceae bacterium]MDD2854847.1 transporter [Desulfuromonadaceae bacterium]
MKYLRIISSVLNAILLLFFLGDLSWGIELSEKPPVASISIGGDFSSGNYNSDNTTRRTYIPLIINWYPEERIDLSVELPFISQTSSYTLTPTDVTADTTAKKSVARGPGSGALIHTALPTNTVTSGALQSNTSSTGTSTPYAASYNRSSSVSGLGDIILRAGYIIAFEDGFLPQLRTSIFIKTPTASVSDGLGTGKLDFGGGFDLSKWIGSVRFAGEALYNYQGKVDGWGLKNYINYSGTLGYQLTDEIQPMLVINGATSPSIYDDDLLEARARLFWSVTTATALDLYVSRGISKSSPDYAGGIAVIYSF